MELLQKAITSNDFGLRKEFPWSERRAENGIGPKINSENILLAERFHLYDILKNKISIFEPDTFIGRIENPYLWSRYLLRYEEMKTISSSVTERIVIHATSISTAYEIAENNFDWRLVKRCRFGQGVSFARDVNYAAKQATQKDAYIITGILMATSKLGNYNTNIPPKNADTTTNQQKSVFVKYYDSDFYPYYIVY